MEDNQTITKMKVTTKCLILTSVVATCILLAQCSTRKSLPIAGPVSLTQNELRGQAIFMEHCQRCHPQGEAGLGPSIHWAPSFAKRFQVRHGVGTMPAFGEEHISNKELDKLMEYLKAVKRNS